MRPYYPAECIGRGVYLVRSWSHPDAPNTVDLEANDGVGQCTCDDWTYRCYPNYLKAKRDGTPLWVPSWTKERTMCHHMESARWLFCNTYWAESSANNQLP